MGAESRGIALLVGSLVVLALLGAWSTATGKRLDGFETIVIAAALVLLVLRAFTAPLPLGVDRADRSNRKEQRLGCTECGSRLQATRRTDGVSVWTCFTCGAEAPVAATKGIKVGRVETDLL